MRTVPQPARAPRNTSGSLLQPAGRAGVARHRPVRRHRCHRPVPAPAGSPGLDRGGIPPRGHTVHGSPAYGLVLQEDADQFLLLGRGITAAFSSADHTTKVSLLSVDELDFDGQWTVTRRLNGDEPGSGSALALHTLDTSQPAFFPIHIPMTFTGIARVRLSRPPR
ncbi:DUF5597 domain-containing protein [Nonomuraea sp. NPDC026600]|uniref:DUF5597 domain-containing protein n=1 Tax=Nonomuraea sp. NPDC026600 TaxID=3155363 RepID=UPI0033DCB238